MIAILKKYLKTNGYYSQNQLFEDLFLSHPNYPSVFAITDSLDLLSIENIAIKIPKEQFIDLPNNFLGMYNDKMVLVTKKAKNIIIETEDAKIQKLTFKEFLTGWNEIILAIEPNTKTIIKKEKINLNWLVYTLPFIALITASVAINSYNFYSTLFLTTSLLGLVLSFFIVQEKLGIKNQITTKLCNINPSASCDTLIQSKNSEINKWISLSDLPLLFFSISTISVLLQPKFSNFTIGFLSVMAIPAIIYSIWLQKFKLKKWCVLCLGVSTIIMIQASVFGFENKNWTNYSMTNLYPFIFSFILLSSLWFTIKSFVENKVKFENEIYEFKKFKRNFNFFEFLTKSIEEYDGFEELKGITFGKKNTSTQITLILSPSCGHCHTAFKEAYELFTNYPEKVHLNVLFNINPENKDNSYKIVAENLLALNEQDPQKAKEAIIDWHINRLDLKNWKRKWTVETPHLLVNKQLQNQYFWCLKNEFNYTPVKIINENLFPEGYEISELKYFINDFQQEIEYEEALKVV